MKRFLAILAFSLLGERTSAQFPQAFPGQVTAEQVMSFEEIFAEAHRMVRPRPGETPVRMAKRLSDELLTRDRDRFNIAANAIQFWALDSPRVALPALVARLDDHRPVKVGAVSLENGPQAFEGVRHYGTAPGEGVAPEVWNVILLSVPGYEGLTPYLEANPDRDARAAWRAWLAAGLPGLGPAVGSPPVPTKSPPAQRP